MKLFTLVATLAVMIGLSESFQLDSIDENIKEDRIIGGHTARPGQFPYQVSVRSEGRARNMTYGWFKHRCGGSIISRRWVLTAAHCTPGYYDWRASMLTVAVGAHHLEDDGQIYILDRIENHPEFRYRTLFNDICLLRTVEDIQFNQRVQPVPLRRRFVDEGAVSILSGWGMTTMTNENPQYLQFLSQTTITNDNCFSSHLQEQQKKIYNGTLCAIAQKGHAPCYGDSGSALVSSGQLIGVVSWGHACAKGYPDGYTRVTAFLAWIEEVSGVVAV